MRSRPREVEEERLIKDAVGVANAAKPVKQAARVREERRVATAKGGIRGAPSGRAGKFRGEGPEVVAWGGAGG
jgi:hypothetical protein